MTNGSIPSVTVVREQLQRVNNPFSTGGDLRNNEGEISRSTPQNSVTADATPVLSLTSLEMNKIAEEAAAKVFKFSTYQEFTTYLASPVASAPSLDAGPQSWSVAQPIQYTFQTLQATSAEWQQRNK